MDWETAAQGFAAMGSEPRLQVLKALVRVGEDGLTVGDIQDRTGLAPSTLAHHLKFMAAAGLIRQIKTGRTVFSYARLDHLEDLANFVLSECCADQRRRAANDG